MSYTNKIKIIRKNKYSFFFDGSKKFLKDYLNSRFFFRKKLMQSKFIKKSKTIKNDKTFSRMLDIYQKNKKSKLKKNDLQFLTMFITNLKNFKIKTIL